MRRTYVEDRLGIGDAGPDIVPFPSPPRRPTVSEILTREFNRLADQNRPNNLWLACARAANHCQRWYHWTARKHLPYRAVFVIATPRSGSNLLMDYLRWLPGAGCLSEVLNWGCATGPKKLSHPQQVVKHLQQSLQTMRTTHRACKIFLHELEHYRLTIEDLERGFLDARYLVLYRENLAEQYVSREIALRTGQWILQTGQPRKNAAITVDPAALQHYCQETRRMYANLTSHSATAQRGAIISYEDLVASPGRCLRDVVCPLLGVPYSEPKSSLCKQNVMSLASRVTNYSEVASILNGPLCRFQLRTNGIERSSAKAA